MRTPTPAQRPTGEFPSGESLDRATKLIMETGHNQLVNEVAKLMERADAAVVLPTTPADRPLREAFFDDAVRLISGAHSGSAADRHLEAADKMLRRHPVVRLVSAALSELEFALWRLDDLRNQFKVLLDDRESFARRVSSLEAAAGNAAVRSLTNVPTDQLLAELGRRLAERPPAAPHDVLDMS